METSLAPSADYTPSGKTHPMSTIFMIFPIVSALLLPPIVVLLISGVVIGYGDTSWGTIGTALQAIGPQIRAGMMLSLISALSAKSGFETLSTHEKADSVSGDRIYGMRMTYLAHE